MKTEKLRFSDQLAILTADTKLIAPVFINIVRKELFLSHYAFIDALHKLLELASRDIPKIRYDNKLVDRLVLLLISSRTSGYSIMESP